MEGPFESDGGVLLSLCIRLLVPHLFGLLAYVVDLFIGQTRAWGRDEKPVLSLESVGPYCRLGPQIERQLLGEDALVNIPLGYPVPIHRIRHASEEVIRC